MILLLLLLTACHVVQANFQPCPADSACLYHARCVTDADSNSGVTTTEMTKWTRWNTRIQCDPSQVSSTELYIRPLSSHKWNFTLEFTHENDSVVFENLLTIVFNEAKASFFIDSDAPIKIPFDRNDTVITFIVDSPQKKLLDLFNQPEISFIDESNITSFKQAAFWETVDRLDRLTPAVCDVSLIIDDCSDAKNCTALDIVAKGPVQCPEGTMWKKSDNSSWLQLRTVFCLDDQWDVLDTGKKDVPMPKEGMEIRCAVDEPEPWTASLTGRTPSKEIVDEKEKAEGKAEFALMNSPFTWVGIGVVGIIALAAVALAIVYAHRKLGKNPAASKSGTKVGFHQVPQDPQVSQTGASNSNSEADLPKADKPLITPAAPDADVTRADAPTADTVNRLSMIKTIRDESNIGTPIPPPLSI